MPPGLEPQSVHDENEQKRQDGRNESEQETESPGIAVVRVTDADGVVTAMQFVCCEDVVGAGPVRVL